MIKERFGHRIDGWVHTFFPFLFWRPINPDLLSVTGTLIASGAALAFADGSFRLAGWLLISGGFFDLVDGVVARHFETSTRFGAFLDSSLDRVVDILVMVGLLVFFAQEPSAFGEPSALGEPLALGEPSANGEPSALWNVSAHGRSSAIGVGLCTVILVASILTSYARARAELVLDRLPGGLLERGERIGLLAVGAILGVLWPVLWLLAIGTVVTAGQRFIYAQREMSRLDLEEKAVHAVETVGRSEGG